MIRRRRLDEETGVTLASLASEPVEAPDPSFTDGLEGRLRMVHAAAGAAKADASAAAVRDARPRRPAPAFGWLGWLAPVVLAGAGIAGAVVLTGGEGTVPRPNGTAVQVVHAADAQYIGPHGAATPLHPGVRLPDGTIVRTGGSGHLEADGADLGPDTEAVVDGGHLTVLGRTHEAPPPAPAPATTQTVAPPGQPAAPSGGQRGGGAEGPAAPSSAPGGPSPAPPGHGPGRVASSPASLQLSVHEGPHGTEALSWSEYSGPDLYGYVVLRSSPPDDPAYPRDVIHFVPAGSAPSYVDAPGRAARYQVDAIDSSGDVLAASAVEH
jgi:hypothetical protein